MEQGNKKITEDKQTKKGGKNCRYLIINYLSKPNCELCVYAEVMGRYDNRQEEETDSKKKRKEKGYKRKKQSVK